MSLSGSIYIIMYTNYINLALVNKFLNIRFKVTVIFFKRNFDLKYSL